MTRRMAASRTNGPQTPKGWKVLPFRAKRDLSLQKDKAERRKVQFLLEFLEGFESPSIAARNPAHCPSTPLGANLSHPLLARQVWLVWCGSVPFFWVRIFRTLFGRCQAQVGV